jgi:shikimate kinase
MVTALSNIFLIGMPGSGKSYWAEQLAQLSGRLHIDLDSIVEQIGGADIATLFATKGEAHFRILEQQALQQILATHSGNMVLACGGGTPCFFDNMQLLQAAGRVVYLHAGIDRLLEQVMLERAKRPLLQQGDLRTNLERLLQQRAAIYEQADVIVDVASISASALMEQLKA